TTRGLAAALTRRPAIPDAASVRSHATGAGIVAVAGTSPPRLSPSVSARSAPLASSAARAAGPRAAACLVALYAALFPSSASAAPAARSGAPEVIPGVELIVTPVPGARTIAVRVSLALGLDAEGEGS